MRLRTVLTLCACVGLLLGCSGKEAPKKHSAPPVKVGVALVSIGNIEKPLILSGDLTFKADADIAARVSSQCATLDVVDGQFVKKGQTLITLDETEIRELANAARADLKKHEAAMEFAKTEWEKNKNLLKTSAVSPIEYDRRISEYHTAAAQVEVDKALLAKAEQDLKWTRVVSPIDGVLSCRWVEKGDWIARGQKLFEISDYSEIYLKAFLSDKDVARLKNATKEDLSIEAKVTVDAMPGKNFKGKITYIAPAARKGKVFEVRAYIDNPDMVLREGMFARAKIVPERIADVTRTPVAALLGKVRDNSANEVFVVDKENKVRLTMIVIGASDDNYAEVKKGLKEGDRVVVYGAEVLSAGTLVEPTNMAPGQTSH